MATVAVENLKIEQGRWKRRSPAEHSRKHLWASNLSRIRFLGTQYSSPTEIARDPAEEDHMERMLEG